MESIRVTVEEVTRTGYDRIVNIIDASSEIDTDKFDSATDFNLNRVGKAALAESFEEVILDGEHSKASGYVYEKDFGLGTRFLSLVILNKRHDCYGIHFLAR